MKTNMKLINDFDTTKNIIIVILKFIGIFIGLSIVLIVAIYTIDYIRVKSFHPPERLSNIPEGAIWKGGVDGGNWYYLLGKQDSIYKIEIYNDYNGESFNKDLFNNEKNFVICEECKGQIDTVSNILQHISYYGGDKIYLNFNDKNNKLCYLELLSQHNKINSNKH